MSVFGLGLYVDLTFGAADDSSGSESFLAPMAVVLGATSLVSLVAVTIAWRVRRSDPTRARLLALTGAVVALAPGLAIGALVIPTLLSPTY